MATAILSILIVLMGFALCQFYTERKVFGSILKMGSISFFQFDKNLKVKKILGDKFVADQIRNSNSNLSLWIEKNLPEADARSLFLSIEKLKTSGEASSTFSINGRKGSLSARMKSTGGIFGKKFFFVIFDEGEAQKTANFYSDILDSFPCPIYAKNVTQNDIYIYSNKFHAEVVCRTKKELLKEGRTDFDFFDDKTAKELRRIDNEVPITGEIYHEFFPLVSTRGDSTIYYSFKTAYVKENGDKFVFGISFDIDEFIETQKTLQRSADNEKLINRCLRLLLSAESDHDIFEEVVKLIGTTFKADRCYIYEIDRQKDGLKNAAMWKASDIEDCTRIILPPKILAHASEELRRENIIKIDDASVDTRPLVKILKPVLETREIQSTMVVGIQNRGTLVGFIGLDYVKARHKHSSFEEQILHSIASILEIFLQRRAVVEKIEYSEAEKRMILDSLDVPVMLFDNRGKMLFVNSASAKLVGKPAEQILSEPCFINYCGESGMEGVCSVREVIETKKPKSIEAKMHGRDMIIKLSPIMDKSGNVTNVVEFNIDVTEFNEKSKALIKAMDDARAADRAKSYFLATMSHELRTPLNSVIGYSELMQDESLDREERVQNLQNINFAANSLLSLINDVLDLSKLEAEHMNMNSTPTDMEALLEDLSKIFQFKASNKRLYLRLNIPHNFPILLLDPLRIKQVLMNLMGNAIKFTNEGGVEVNVKFEETSKDEGSLFVSVKDTGAGISKKFMEKIFNPFERDSDEAVRGTFTTEGTGLGLAISKRLVDKMGGDITVSSELGAGTTFTIEIPKVKLGKASQIEKKKEEKSPFNADLPKFSFSGKTYIVDDIPMNLSVLSAMLKKLGIAHESFPSAREVLARVRQEKPTIILSDLWMPEMSGAELADIIKKTPETSEIPIVAITADTQFNGNEFDDIILKPITVKSISGIFAKFFPKD